MKSIAIFPGTFDPITNGHIDLIERAAQIFANVVIGVALSQKKKTLFNIDERVLLAKKSLQHLSNVHVEGFSSLLVHFAQEKKANVILRGLRGGADFEYELQLANMNRAQSEHLETIFLTPNVQSSFISASLVREIAEFKGDISAFVPKDVQSALTEKYK